MENEQILSVLTELLEEQKEDTKLLLGISTQLNTLEARMDKLEEKRGSSKAFPNLTDMNSIQNQLSETADQIKNMLRELPKNTIQEKRILLFPEQNAREYYSGIFRWLLYIIIATYGYWIIKHAISSFAQ